jgi:DNA-binding IclR family transcriptional regulator
MAAASGSLTLERSLALLDHVAAGVDRLDALAAAAGLSRSSAHRMLTSFVRAGHLSLGDDGRYRLGTKLLELGVRAEAAVNAPAEINAVLARLSADTRDATHLGVLEGRDVLYLAKARGHRGIETASRVGTRFPAQSTAMGKLLLSADDDARVAEVFDPSIRPTPNAITELGAFRDRLAEIRAQGWALDDQENEQGVTCVAIGVHDLAGELAAAISVSAPTVHMPAERIPALVERMRGAAGEITRFLPPGFVGRWF